MLELIKGLYSLLQILVALANTRLKISHLLFSLGNQLLGLGGLELFLLNFGGQSLHLVLLLLDCLTVLFNF